MTTIAIDHNTISADGRATSGQGYILSDKTQKIFAIGDTIYAYCGEMADAEELLHIVDSKSEIPDMTLDAMLVSIDSDGIYMHTIGNGKYRSNRVDIPFAMGSGDHFALSSMDFGKTSKEAVKYAMTRDSSTGGKIKTMTWRK